MLLFGNNPSCYTGSYLPQRKKAPEPQQLRFRGFKEFICKILHHTAFRHCRNCRCRFRDVDDTALGGKEHAGY